MGKEEKAAQKTRGKERKPYQKPALTAEELFEATVLACSKRIITGCRRPRRAT